ncbi:MAG: glycosyltransferase [Chitinophagaceae bacterium]|nr:MAG: glycosyltransferase [Chitinophagaceae bacterium]
MVSVIICSYRPDYFEKLSKNIEQTIGIDFEIVKVDNRIRKVGICKAYNEGASLAKHEFLCFVHEDVIFKTKNWGKALVQKFKDEPSIGLVGIAGSKYKSLAPGLGWYNNHHELDRLHLIQHSKHSLEVVYENRISKEYDDVVCVDGVFLFTTNRVWHSNKFDEKTFKNFHCYDLDFSLNVHQQYKVLVTNQILLEHFSLGNTDHVWLAESLKLSQKWKGKLPIGNLSRNDKKRLEWIHKKWFIKEMVKHGYPRLEILKVLFGFGTVKFFSFTQFKSIIGYLLPKFIRTSHG